MYLWSTLLLSTFTTDVQILLNIFAFKFKNIYAIYFYKIIKLITGLKITYDKKNHNRRKKGTLYVANHVSWFDIICLGTLLNARFIAKKEVSKMGIFGFLAKLSNTFFIDNSDKNKIIEYIRNYDTPTISNSLELLDSSLRSKGHTQKTMHCLNPKLKPEWDAIILFGPGVKDVAIPNKIKVKNWGYIF